MDFFSWIIALVIVFIGGHIIKLFNFIKVINKIPGPPVLRKPVNPAHLAVRGIKWIEEYGTLIKAWNGPFAFVLVCDPDDIRTALNNETYAFESPSRNVLKLIMGEGLLNANGETWEKHRKLLNPGFGFSIVKKMVPLMVEVGQSLLNQWKDLSPNEEVNMKVYFKRTTLDLIGSTAFGTKFDSLSGKHSDISKAILEVTLFENVSLLYYLLAQTFSWFTYLPLSFTNMIKTNKKTIASALGRIIEERSDERFQKSNERDILGLLLNAKEGDTKLSVKEINDEALTFLFAGHDTTAALLMWLFYELSLNPEVHAKLQEEVDSVLQGSLPTAENLSKLKYLSMVVNETLRLHPPVPAIRRVANRDITLHGYTIPKGTSVHLAVLTVHMSEKYWNNPTEFKPSRWENLSEEETKAFFPFGLGPRSCIGRYFAILEAKVVASIIMQQYELKLVENQAIKPIFLITASPSSLLMRIVKRKVA